MGSPLSCQVVISETRAGFPCSHCCASLTAWVRGENTARGMVYLQWDKWGRVSPKSLLGFSLAFPDAAGTHCHCGGWSQGAPSRSLCPPCVLCQMAAPTGKVTSFFDMCLYAGDAFSFLKNLIFSQEEKRKNNL